MVRRMMKRRDALKTIGGLAGMAGMAKFLPGCGDGDDGSVGITTYVYLMLENRTYNYVFGARALSGLGGDGLRADMTNPDMMGNPVGIYQPVGTEACPLDPPHGWDTSREQFNAGAMDGFVRVHQREHGNAQLRDPMQYLTRNEQPISWALADAYTSCDRWFASVMGPTLPNRAYWHTATSFGLKDNTSVLNTFTNLPVPSIYNRFQDAGVDWRFYYGNIAVASLLANPGPYQLDIGEIGTGNVRRFGNAEAGTGTFFDDCKKGNLPSVVYIDPAFYENDDHPPIHPIKAQALIASIYTALANSPQWKNCMLVITYDEHGGYFDHVAPPTVMDDTLAKYGVDGFQQLGFRVPAMVAGPYVKQNYVSSVQYDHTSALKHLENAFGLEPLTARDANANDLSDCIDMDRLARGEWAPPIELPQVDLDAFPWDEPQCLSNETFRKDPISEWADAHPGAFPPGADIRDADANEAVRNFLRNHYRETRK